MKNNEKILDYRDYCSKSAVQKYPENWQYLFNGMMSRLAQVKGESARDAVFEDAFPGVIDAACEADEMDRNTFWQKYIMYGGDPEGGLWKLGWKAIDAARQFMKRHVGYTKFQSDKGQGVVADDNDNAEQEQFDRLPEADLAGKTVWQVWRKRDNEAAMIGFLDGEGSDRVREEVLTVISQEDLRFMLWYFEARGQRRKKKVSAFKASDRKRFERLMRRLQGHFNVTKS